MSTADNQGGVWLLHDSASHNAYAYLCSASCVCRFLVREECIVQHLQMHLAEHTGSVTHGLANEQSCIPGESEVERLIRVNGGAEH